MFYSLPSGPDCDLESSIEARKVKFSYANQLPVQKYINMYKFGRVSREFLLNIFFSIGLTECLISLCYVNY